MMSDRMEVDFPMCEECTDTILDQLDTKLKEAMAMSADYTYDTLFLGLARLEQKV